MNAKAIHLLAALVLGWSPAVAQGPAPEPERPVPAGTTEPSEKVLLEATRQLEAGDATAALKLLSELGAQTAARWEAQLLLAVAHLRRDDLVLARRAVERALIRCPAEHRERIDAVLARIESAEELESLRVMAREQVLERRFHRAAESFTRLWLRDPTDHDAGMSAASAWSVSGDLLRARDVYRALLQDPALDAAHAARARTALEQLRPSLEARAARALEDGAFLRENGRLDQAARSFSEAWESTGDPRAMVQLAIVAVRRGDRADALAALDEALAADGADAASVFHHDDFIPWRGLTELRSRIEDRFGPRGLDDFDTWAALRTAALAPGSGAALEALRELVDQGRGGATAAIALLKLERRRRVAEALEEWRSLAAFVESTPRRRLELRDPEGMLEAIVAELESALQQDQPLPEDELLRPALAEVDAACGEFLVRNRNQVADLLFHLIETAAPGSREQALLGHLIRRVPQRLDAGFFRRDARFLDRAAEVGNLAACRALVEAGADPAAPAAGRSSHR